MHKRTRASEIEAQSESQSYSLVHLDLAHGQDYEIDGDTLVLRVPTQSIGGEVHSAIEYLAEQFLPKGTALERKELGEAIASLGFRQATMAWIKSKIL